MVRLRICVVAVVLALCGLTARNSSSQVSPAQQQPSTHTVTDPSGRTVELPSNPQRVFGMYTTDLDYAITLGLKPAPVQSIRNGSTGFPDFFPQQPLADLEPLTNYPEPQYEKIAEIKPDLIINGLGYKDGPEVSKLAAIAPTYTYDGFDGDWREDLSAMAEAFGKQSQAEEISKQISQRTATVKAKVDELDHAPVIAFGWANADGSGAFNGSAPTTLGMQVFNDLGIKAPKAVGKDWTEISAEHIADLDDVDLIMVAVETDTSTAKVAARIKKNRIWAQLPAVRDGHLSTVNNELSYASPHAHLEFLNVVERDLDLLTK